MSDTGFSHVCLFFRSLHNSIHVYEQNAYLRLDTVLLETSPVDPPPPRRSSRCTVEDNLPATPIKKIRLTKTKNVHNECMMDVTNAAGSRYEGSVSTLDIPLGEHDETISNHNGDPTGRAMKRQAKNVGGWISPDFAKDIDRSWLEGHVPPYNNKETFNLSTYVPQIGDIILYVLVLYHHPF